jgi:hypothetical protein
MKHQKLGLSFIRTYHSLDSRSGDNELLDEFVYDLMQLSFFEIQN